jgi:hypothetical protein
MGSDSIRWFRSVTLFSLALCVCLIPAGVAQSNTDVGAATQDKATPDKEKKEAAPALPGSEYSGMYAFLRDGEFVQVTVEDQGHITGFVSRYGDLESDRGAFLDHFFKQGKLAGNRLTFTTETVHGVWFEFRGTVERGEGKNAGDEGYYVLKGSLTETATDEQKKTSSRSREVALKSFPQDLAPAPPKRN